LSDHYRTGKRVGVGIGGILADDPSPPIAASREDPVWVISVVCGVLLVLHLGVRALSGMIKDGLDVIALGLIIVGLSPWLAAIIKSLKLGGFEVSFQEVERTLEEQRGEINQLKFLIAHFLPEWEYQHLVNLASRKPFTVNLDQVPKELENELRHLRALGFIHHKDGSSISGFIEKGERVKNVSEYFGVTDSGRELLSYRQDETPPPLSERLGSQAAS
jgi:hypothetical protein